MGTQFQIQFYVPDVDTWFDHGTAYNSLSRAFYEMRRLDHKSGLRITPQGNEEQRNQVREVLVRQNTETGYTKITYGKAPLGIGQDQGVFSVELHEFREWDKAFEIAKLMFPNAEVI